MENAGLIAREPCPDDRRGAYAVVSAAGRAMRKRMWPTYNAEIDRLVRDHLTDGEARQLLASLRKLIAGVREESS
jgi:DNA-binding MarR family transcriptional regulator